MKYDVFISYSSLDQKVVEGLCGHLESRGVRCFVAYRDIPRGVVWADAIVEALDESRMMVVVFSDHFNNSPQVNREIEIASEDRKHILTYRLTDTAFRGAKKYYLKNLNWIDAFPDPEKSFGSVAEGVAKLLDLKLKSVAKVERKAEPMPVVAPAPEPEQQTVVVSEPKPAPTPAPVPTPKPIPTPPPAPKKRNYLPYVVALLVMIGAVKCWHSVLTDSPTDPVIEVVDSVAMAEEDSLVQEKVEQERLEKERQAKAEQERVAQAKAEAERKKQEAAVKQAEQERIAQMVKEGKGRDGVYQVGDYYNRNGKQGVVFAVSDGGKHGKIVSLPQSQEKWCSDEEYERKIETGANDQTNGVNNQRKIAQISSWREKYPAFKWCADQGDGWYLPAIEELITLLLNDAVHDAVNRTLEAKGATKLYNKGEGGFYWSSTEHDYTGSQGWRFCAWRVNMYNGSTYSSSKDLDFYVRAVSAF